MTDLPRGRGSDWLVFSSGKWPTPSPGGSVSRGMLRAISCEVPSPFPAIQSPFPSSSKVLLDVFPSGYLLPLTLVQAAPQASTPQAIGENGNSARPLGYCPWQFHFAYYLDPPLVLRSTVVGPQNFHFFFFCSSDSVLCGLTITFGRIWGGQTIHFPRPLFGPRLWWSLNLGYIAIGPPEFGNSAPPPRFWPLVENVNY